MQDCDLPAVSFERTNRTSRRTDSLSSSVLVLQDQLTGTKDDEGKQADDDDAQNDKEQKRAGLSSGPFWRCDRRLHEYLDAWSGVAGDLNFDWLRRQFSLENASRPLLRVFSRRSVLLSANETVSFGIVSGEGLWARGECVLRNLMPWLTRKVWTKCLWRREV
jgi:hypothetical protein